MNNRGMRNLKLFSFAFAFIYLTMLSFTAFANPEIDEDGWCHFPKDAKNANNEVKANGKCGFIDQDGGNGAEGSASWEIKNVQLTQTLATVLGKRLRFHLTSEKAYNIPCELNTNDSDYLSNDWEADIRFKPYRKRINPKTGNYAGSKGTLSMTLTCRAGSQR